MTNCNTNVGKKPHSHSYIYNSLRKGIVALAIPLAACGVHSDDDTAHLNTKAVSSHAPNTLAAQGDSTSAQTTQAPSRRRTKAVVSAGSGNHALTSYEVRRLYGPGVFRQDALANTIVGINGRREQIVSNRFRATINGHLSTARLYWQPGRGYSAGNGGNIRLRLMPDDGSGAHRPNMSATPLATAYFTPGSAAYRGNPIFNDAYFSSQQPLVAGRIYHLVLDNIHPAPHQNYISSNNTITHSGNGRPSRWVSPTDWATLLGTRNAWSGGGFSWNDMTQSPAGGNYYVPILQLTTRNGQKQGSSAMESGAVDPQRIFTATASHPVRERFRPYSTKRQPRWAARCAGASCRATANWPAAASAQVQTTTGCSSSPRGWARSTGMTPRSAPSRCRPARPTMWSSCPKVAASGSSPISATVHTTASARRWRSPNPTPSTA